MQVPDWAGKPQEGSPEIKCANLSSSVIKDYQERNKVLPMVGHINQNSCASPFSVFFFFFLGGGGGGVLFFSLSPPLPNPPFFLLQIQHTNTHSMKTA